MLILKEVILEYSLSTGKKTGLTLSTLRCQRNRTLLNQYRNTMSPPRCRRYGKGNIILDMNDKNGIYFEYVIMFPYYMPVIVRLNMASRDHVLIK